MTKKELVYGIALEAGLSSADAAKAVDAFMKVIVKSLQKGETVSLMGFGSFFVSNMTERKCINTKTKRQIVIPAAKVPRFRVASRLREAVMK